MGGTSGIGCTGVSISRGFSLSSIGVSMGSWPDIMVGIPREMWCTGLAADSMKGCAAGVVEMKVRLRAGGAGGMVRGSCSGEGVGMVSADAGKHAKSDSQFSNPTTVVKWHEQMQQQFKVTNKQIFQMYSNFSSQLIPTNKPLFVCVHTDTHRHTHTGVYNVPSDVAFAVPSSDPVLGVASISAGSPCTIPASTLAVVMLASAGMTSSTYHNYTT